MTSAAQDAIAVVAWLRSSAGAQTFERLAELGAKTPHDRSKIALGIKRIMPQQPTKLVNLALDIFFARLKMADLGAWTQSGFFLDQTRQQATSPELASWHSKRFAGCNKILEIGTGTGCDTRALAQGARHVVTIEIDPLLAEFARYNLALQLIENVEVRNCDLAALDDGLLDFDGVWADPARRSKDGRRIKDPQHYSPSLAQVINIIERIDPTMAGIKLSASLDRSHLPSGWSGEWIGSEDECRELVAWRCRPQRADCASLADFNLSWEVINCETALIDLDQLKSAFLIEPHGALIRTQALQGFAAAHDFLMWDHSIAYMLAPSEPPASPWYSRFRIIEFHKYGDKLLQQRLSALGWGNRTEFKKRGFPLTPEQVRARMKLEENDEFGTVVLTRRDSEHYFFLCERLHA